MVRPKSVHRDRDRVPVWLQRCKAVFGGRALAVAAPLALTLAFGVIYSLYQSPYVNQNATDNTLSTAHQLSGTQSPASNLALDSTSAQNGAHPSTDNTAAGNSSVQKPNSDTSLTSGTNRVLGVATTVCNTVAKTLATTTQQAAIAAENLRHSKLLAQIESEGILGTLLEQTNLTNENALHTLNLQKIATTYSQSLRAANCT